MPLELVPTLEQLDIPALEAHLTKCRSERLILRIKYKQAQNQNLSVLRVKTREKLSKKLELFKKDLDRLDEVLEKARLRLEEITILRNETHYIDQAISED